MRSVIDRSSYVPIYVQIQHHLREKVAAHADPNTPFHSDNELAEMFGVNRLTVRRAIQDLVDEGLLYRVRGAGTFVRSPKVAGEPLYQRGFVSQWSMQGKVVEARILTLEERPAPLRATKALDLPEKTVLLFVKRLRTADGLSVVLDDIYLPAQMIAAVTSKDFEAQTIAQLLFDKLRRRPKTAAIEIEAVKVRRLEAHALGIRVGDPVLLRRITMLSETEEPLSYGESYHRSDLFKYSLRVPVKIEGL